MENMLESWQNKNHEEQNHYHEEQIEVKITSTWNSVFVMVALFAHESGSQ